MSTSPSFYCNQSNLVIPELDNDPAILKIIFDGEKLERDTRRKELMQLLKIQPPPVVLATESDESGSPSMNVNNGNFMTPRTTDTDWTSQIWIKRTVPVTPNSSFYRRPHYRSALHQHSLNSSGESTNHSLDSTKSTNKRSDINISSSPTSSSNNLSPPLRGKNNSSIVSSTPSGVIVTDYRQTTTMKRIVNPQWNIIPFA